MSPPRTKWAIQGAELQRRKRRERIARRCLQGMLAGADPAAAGNPDMAAEYAVQFADALIARLDQEDGE